MSNEHPTHPGSGDYPSRPEPPQYHRNMGAQGQNQWQQWQNPQQQPAYSEYPYEDSDGDSKFLPILGIILAAILAIALILGAAYYFGWFGDDNGKGNGGSGGGTSQSQNADGGSTSTNGNSEDTSSDNSDTAEEESSSQDETSESEGEDSRPTRPKLPSGAVPANQSAEQDKPGGDFNNVYTGSDITSKPFARAVRDAFVEHYLDTDETNGTVKAYSSVTGQTYTMSCKDNGQYVTCTGGNDAIVYIA